MNHAHKYLSIEFYLFCMNETTTTTIKFSIFCCKKIMCIKGRHTQHSVFIASFLSYSLSYISTLTYIHHHHHIYYIQHKKIVFIFIYLHFLSDVF
jgi:hypothetical protein